MASITMQFEGLQEFASTLKEASGPAFKEELKLFMNVVGLEFLNAVQSEIRACNSVVTGLLINSFSKGGTDNVWEESGGGLTIDVGSNVEYARYVNDGHSKTPKGVKQRFVPGHWTGEGDGAQFKYEPTGNHGKGRKSRSKSSGKSSKGKGGGGAGKKPTNGMVLKEGFVEAKHYWEAAQRHIEPVVQRLAENAVSQWAAKYFG